MVEQRKEKAEKYLHVMVRGSESLSRIPLITRIIPYHALQQRHLRTAYPVQDRPLFNWAHWLLGMTAWSLASATFVMALPLGKTGSSLLR